MRKDKLIEEVSIPSGVTIALDGNMVSVTGPKGTLSKQMLAYKVKLEVKDSKLILSSLKPSKNEKRMIGTFSSHISNMIKGVTKGYEYKLKVSSGHFPMSVDVKGNTLEIKNFFGERKPRIARLLDGTKVTIHGEEITVTGIDKELVGQTSANIEQATRVTNRDKRVFMDRINIIKKDED